MRSFGNLVYRLAIAGALFSVAAAAVAIARARLGRRGPWGKRIIAAAMTLGLVLGVSSVAGAAWRWYSLRRLLDASTRVDVPNLRRERPRLEPVNFLVLGSDARAIPGYAVDPAGPLDGQRADVLMVLKVDPAGGHATVLSIPRDYYVIIPGYGSQKVNAALELGGPELQVDVVQQLTGIPLDHYMEIDFSGFVRIVQELRGVELCIDNPMRDDFVGIALPRAGCHLMDGVNALNFVRSRHAEFFVDGEWVDDPDGDLGRIKRQQHFVEELMKRALHTGALARAPQYASAIGSALTFDSRFTVGDLVHLVQGFSRPTPDAIDFYSLPGIPDDFRGVSYVFPKQPDADELLLALGGLPIPDSSLPFGR